MAKLFAKNDSGFVCSYCGREVAPLKYSSRNHCPYCLCSLHVDLNPGDRDCGCGGLMYPVSVTPHPRHGFVITHKCSVCGVTRKNKCAADDDGALLICYTNPDNIPAFEKRGH